MEISEIMKKIECLIDKYFYKNPTAQNISGTYQIGNTSIKFEIEK
jgi:hypothetical protein